MEDSVPKTGILYCRVSSSEQVHGTSLAMQERLCHEYAEREGIKVLEVYVERGESAKSADRTEFQKALQFCALKKPVINFFIVHKVDRFARSQVDHFATTALLKKYGTELRSVTEPITNDPVGKAMEGMLAVFAEFDNNVRSSRSRSGMVEKVKRGEWVWRLPLGYKRLVKGGNLVVDDDIAPYIRLAFEEYSKGTHTFRSLAAHLERCGFRTLYGKKPCPQLMEKIIRNPVYAAVIEAFGGRFPGSFAPIISEELYWKCQPRKRSKFGTGKRMKENANFPLRGFVVCTECGTSITGSASTGRASKKYPYYHHHKSGCSLAQSFPKEKFEREFVELLQNVSPSKKYEKVFKEIVVETWKNNYRKLDGENGRLRKEIEVLEHQRQRIFDVYQQGKFTDDEFLEQKSLVNQKIYSKKTQLDERRIEEFNMEEALDYCFRFVGECASTWISLKETPGYRVRFQNQVFPEKVYFDGKKFGTTKTAMVCALNQENGSDKSKLVRVYRAARTYFQSQSD